MRQRLQLLLCLLLLLPSWAVAETSKQASITIIIDDIGNNLRHGQRALELPGAVTYSFLPFTPFSKRLAKQAHQQGKEIMLHLPMDNSHGRPLGPGGLTFKQDRPQYEQQLNSAIAAIPYVSGINNHMGSRLTANTERMQWLMQSLQHYPLYFVDSRTSADSVAATTSLKLKIPTLERNVFLDHVQSTEFIDRQFKRLVKIALKKGSAVAIGHPYPSTLSYLEKVLPQLETMGVQLVSPTQVLALHRTPQFAAMPTSQRVKDSVSDSANIPEPAATKQIIETPIIQLAKAPPEKAPLPKTSHKKAAYEKEGHCQITEQLNVTRVTCS